MTPRRWLLLLAVLIGLGAAGWALSPEPEAPPEPVAAEDEEEGMTDEETEELMRTIGYVQQ